MEGTRAYYLDPEFCEVGLTLSSTDFVNSCEAAGLIEDLVEDNTLAEYHILERALARVNSPRRNHAGGARHEWIATPNKGVTLVATNIARSVRALQTQILEIDRIRSLNLRAINELCGCLTQGDVKCLVA